MLAIGYEWTLWSDEVSNDPRLQKLVRVWTKLSINLASVWQSTKEDAKIQFEWRVAYEDLTSSGCEDRSRDFGPIHVVIMSYLFLIRFWDECSNLLKQTLRVDLVPARLTRCGLMFWWLHLTIFGSWSNSRAGLHRNESESPLVWTLCAPG